MGLIPIDSRKAQTVPAIPGTFDTVHSVYGDDLAVKIIPTLHRRRNQMEGDFAQNPCQGEF
jgi:hypothetical protein